MRKTILAAGLLLVLGPAPARAISAYAAKCLEVIGVPVPDVNCDDPRGTPVPINGGAGGGTCDNPGHGDSKCNPGTRFIRYDDAFTRNGKTEKVTTMVMCRKTDGNRGGPAENSGDIGVIQYNETKHATCWFSSTDDSQLPSKTIIVDRTSYKVYPSPSTSDDPVLGGGNQPKATCVRCHQAGVWLRTPFAMSAPREAGKGYARAGLTQPYGPGDGNTVPRNHKSVSRLGLSCSVGLPAWNTPGSGAASRLVKIDQTAYDRKFGGASPDKAPSGTCTRCHYLGGGPGGMTCATFLPELRSGTNSRRNESADHYLKYWMPPKNEQDDNTPATRDGYLATYGRALDAVAWCCANGGASDYGSICSGSFGTIDSPCALCPDCGGAAAASP